MSPLLISCFFLHINITDAYWLYTFYDYVYNILFIKESMK